MMKKNRCALVTGASSGIGKALACALARAGWDLILVARSKASLQAVAAALGPETTVTPIAADLCTADGVEQVMRAMTAHAEALDLVINNAGGGVCGAVDGMTRDQVQHMLHLNVRALTEVSHHAVGLMKPRGRGCVMNIASVVAFQPCPYFAVYGASKAYVVSFTQALGHELKGTGVHVLCVCPGGTSTAFHSKAGVNRASLSRHKQTPEDVAQEALAALRRGETLITTGRLNRAMGFLGVLLPQHWRMRVAARLFKPLNEAGMP